MEKNKKPGHFLTLKIVGFIAIAVAIIGLILVVTGFGNFGNNNFMIGGFLFTFGLFIGIICLVIGFQPEISKMSSKTTKYIQEENQDTLTDIASTSADIHSEAITKTIKAVKKGLNDTKFCKHCGAQIDSDSKFCSECGKEQ